MAKRFLFDDESKPAERGGLSYVDGFRFGFGIFIAWLIGLMLVSGVGAMLARLLHWHY
jgi:hypothetical protein